MVIRSDVLAVNRQFERAFSSLDIKSLEATWAHDRNVTVIHPVSKTPLIGWDAVRKSWEEALSRWIELSVSMDEPHVGIGSNVAWVVAVERVRGRRPNGDAAEFSALTTNVYEKREGSWLMVHHHASRMPQ